MVKTIKGSELAENIAMDLEKLCFNKETNPSVLMSTVRLHINTYLKDNIVVDDVELHSRIKQREEWLMNVKNQMPCNPMPDCDWFYYATLYWENLWNILDDLKKILGDKSDG